MLHYNRNLKRSARLLRKKMTESERALWSRVRGKQLLGIQFYRQKPIGPYIVDFYAPKAKLVVEVDGSQHKYGSYAKKDLERDQILADHGLQVLRFDSRQVLKDTDAVVVVIYHAIEGNLGKEIPPVPPLKRGER